MADRIGQQLGNYTMTRLLGKGGFADVYLGEHIFLKTPVAVKVLQTRISGQEDLESFVKEAQMVAHLKHPHIIRILDFGVERDQETPYLVMDYAPHGTLRVRHPRGTRLPLATAVSYVQQLAQALQYAHDEKLIHRDVKPENMLLDHNDNVVLGDFGTALLAQTSLYQQTQDVMGTVAYMSPEQIQGKPRPASDQYALGITVYEWLSGERPFQGSFIELCAQHVLAPLPSLREKVPELPPQVEQVVSIALAKDAKQRFGSIRAFATALSQASQSSPSLSKSPSLGVPEISLPSGASQPGQLPAIQSAGNEEGSLAPGRPPDSRMQRADVPQLPPTVLAVPALAVNPSITPPQQSQGEPRQSHKIAPASPVSPAKYPWSIGRSQILAMLISTFICAFLTFIVDRTILLPFLNEGTLPPFFTSIGDNPYLPTLYSLIFDLIFAVLFFSSATFGPWVGLLSAAVGFFLGDIFLLPIGSFWYFPLCSALICFFPGLAYLKRSNTIPLAQAVAWSLVGIGIGTLGNTLGNLEVTLSISSDAISPDQILQTFLLPIFSSQSLALVCISLPLFVLALAIYNHNTVRRHSVSSSQ